MSTSLKLAHIARKLTGRFVFQKRLPVEFGGARINVTSRSDIRLLAPGFKTVSDLLHVASHYIQPENCVWDIGANLGIFSFLSAWKAGEKGHVFSLEADPFYAELQHKSGRTLPAGYAPFTPLCAAIADKIGILELCIPKNGHSRNHLSIVEGNRADMTETRKQVVTITGDFLLQHWTKPDFVKVDVEGAEMLFLKGATSLVERIRPTFYIEINESSQEAATQIFKTANYKFFEVSSAGTEKPVNRCLFNTIVKPAERC